MILKFKDIVENKDIIGEYKSRDLVKLYCDHCHEPLKRMKKDIQRAIRENRYGLFCNASCFSNYKSFKNGTQKRECICVNCSLPFMKSNSEIEIGRNNFCSRSCSASYNNRLRFKSEEYKRKTSENMKEKYRNGEINQLNNLYGEFHQCFGKLTSKSTVSKKYKCAVCINTFMSKSVRYTCSDKCLQIMQSDSGYKDIPSTIPPKLICVMCDEEFKGNRKTCSDMCFVEYQSKRQTKYLKNPENRKKYKGRSQPSYMEKSFAEWLQSLGIPNNKNGFLSEVQFFNEDTGKHGWVDFLFPTLKLIIELDGTQHNKRKHLDDIRDAHLKERGYYVFRITYSEYQKQTKKGALLEHLKSLIFRE